MPGIRIAHTTARNVVYLVPIVAKPFTGPFDAEKDKCPTCHLVHPVKTVHLWLDGAGSCIVSQGVFEDLKRAGMPDLTVEGEVANPPPLKFEGKPFLMKTRTHGVFVREEIDNRNRRIVKLGA